MHQTAPVADQTAYLKTSSKARLTGRGQLPPRALGSNEPAQPTDWSELDALYVVTKLAFASGLNTGSG